MHCRSEQSSELTGPILLTSESDIVYFAVGLRRYHGRCQLHHSLAGSVTEPQITCGEPGCRALEVRERRMCAAVYTAITVFAPVNSDAVDCNCCSASRKDKAKGNCCAASLAGNLHVRVSSYLAMSITSAPLAAPGRTWPPPRPRHHQHRRLPHPGCFRILLVHSHVQISLPLGDEKGGPVAISRSPLSTSRHQRAPPPS